MVTYIAWLMVVAALLASGPTLALADRYEDCDQLEDLQRAITACTQIIQNEKGENRGAVAQAYSNRGFAYMEKGQLDRALGDYNQSLKRDSKDDNVYHYRGIVFLKKKQYGRAIAEIDKSLKIEPYNAFAHEDKALALHAWGKSEAGLRSVNRAIKLNPEQSSFYTTRGKIHEALGQKEKAIQDFGSAYHLAPTEPHKKNLERLGVSPHQ